MIIAAEQVKKLRDQTGAGIMDAKKALAESGGDLEKATMVLRKNGQKIVQKKQAREVKEGCIGCYVHANNKVAALVELLCETDFVAKNKEFKELAHDLAMQIVALNPAYLSPQDVPAEEIAKEKEILKGNSELKGKPKNVQEKIIAGKMEKYYEQVCLLKQPFFKDEKIAMEDLVAEKISKLKENIKVGRFMYFSL